jgi:hypothetical protein
VTISLPMKATPCTRLPNPGRAEKPEPVVAGAR